MPGPLVSPPHGLEMPSKSEGDVGVGWVWWVRYMTQLSRLYRDSVWRSAHTTGATVGLTLLSCWVVVVVGVPRSTMEITLRGGSHARSWGFVLQNDGKKRCVLSSPTPLAPLDLLTRCVWVGGYAPVPGC